MKVRNPLDRRDLSITKRDRILEVGSGHNPNYKSNVLAEKFIDSNYHRSGDVMIYPHQRLVNVPGESLPFKDKEFDYIICCQALEHADDPAQFIREQCRVAHRGYMEVPSLIGESLFPKESHRWVILEIDNKLIIYEKAKIGGGFRPDFGSLFLNYLPYQSIAYRILCYTYGNIRNVRYEWKDDMEFIVNPEDEYYSSFFTKKWTQEMIEKIFPPHSLAQDLKNCIKAIWYVMKTSMAKKHAPLMTLEEYDQYQQKNMK